MQTRFTRSTRPRHPRVRSAVVMMLGWGLTACSGGGGGGSGGVADDANLRDIAFSAAYTTLLHYFNDPTSFSAAFGNLRIADDSSSTPDVYVDCPSGSAAVSNNSFATRNASGQITSITLRANLDACQLYDQSPLGNSVYESGGLNYQRLTNGDTTTYGFVLAAAYDTNSGEHRIDFLDSSAQSTGYQYFGGQVSWSETPYSGYTQFSKSVRGNMRAAGPDEDLGDGALNYEIQSNVDIRVERSGDVDSVTYTAGNPEGFIDYADGEACILDGQYFPETREPVVMNFAAGEMTAGAGAVGMQMFIDDSGEWLADINFAGDRIRVEVYNRGRTVGPQTYEFPIDGLMELPSACGQAAKLAMRRALQRGVPALRASHDGASE